MNRNAAYLFQLSKEDLREIADATNPKAGFLITINKTRDGITIEVDKKALALAINGFFRNGGCNLPAAACVNVPFNPPS